MINKLNIIFSIIVLIEIIYFFIYKNEIFKENVNSLYSNKGSTKIKIL
jgi:hypothetical protein